MNESTADLVKADDLPTMAVTPMQMMQIAVQNGTSIEQLQQLMALQERWEANEAKKAFNAAFSAFKAEAVKIIRAKTVEAGPLAGKMYAELYTVVNAVTPALSKHGLSASWKLSRDEKDWIEVSCVVKHILGHSESVAMGGPPDTGGAKSAIQARASTVSYLERYTLKAICGVSEQGDDKDGNGDDLTAAQQQRVQETIALVKEWFAKESVGDAFAVLDEAALDNAEKLYAWGFFDSKQRAALKKEGDIVRARHAATDLITDAQRKRLEARISELKLDRAEIKAYCTDHWGKEHFSDLSKSEYTVLDQEIDALSTNPEKEERKPADKGAADAAPDAAYIDADQCAWLETKAQDGGVPIASLKKAAGVERLAMILAADYKRADAWLTAAIAKRKSA